MSDLRRLYQFVTPYWRSLAVAAVALALSSLITLALPWAIRLLVDSVFLSGDLGALNRMVGVLAALFIAQGFISFGHRYWLTYVAQRVVADLRIAIHSRLLVLPLGFFTRRRTGEIVSRVTNDTALIQGVLTEAPVNLMRQLITLLGGVVLMLVMNWQLTLVILLLIPPIILISTIYGRRIKRLTTAVQDELAGSTTVLEEMLSGVRVVKSFGREPYERQRFSRQIEQAFDASMVVNRARSIFVPIIAFVGFAAMTLLLWVGGRQVIAGAITPGELIAFLFYMVLVSTPLAEAAGLYGRVQEALGASQRIFEILETAPEPVTAPAAQPLPAPVEDGRAHVRFVDVEFAYAAPALHSRPDDAGEGDYTHEEEDGDQTPAQQRQRSPRVLHAINLEARPGEMIALVGYSGAGKTTLVNLLPRFYDPTGGCIEIDGRDIRAWPLADLRARIGLVPQETFLFGGTVRENIAYGRLEATDTEIEAAAQAAYAHRFINDLPDGYATVVGERGVRLSAGQRQRIAIARALLKDPRILILDEATSALDTESERWVQAALDRLMQGRTSFVIAHRLSTIRQADRILVVDQGRIVEQGDHAALLQAGGLYRRLYDLQFSRQTEEQPTGPAAPALSEMIGG